MYYKIINVEPLKYYRLLLTFETGQKKIFDVKPYLNKVIFKDLKDEDIFSSVSFSFDSIEWSNRVLYEDSVEYK